MNFDPTHLSDARVLRAYEYWCGIRRGRELPSRGDIDPSHIVPILPYVILVDVLCEPVDFRFRLAGTDVVRRYGEELTGRRLREIDVDGKYDQIFGEYRLSVERRAPQLFEEEFTREDGHFVHYARMLCPLSADGRTIDMLFGVQVSVGEDRSDPLTGIRRV